MKDELLIKFIDDTATPEEVDEVMRELSSDSEAAKEWLQIVQAAKLAGTKPVQDVPENVVREFVDTTVVKSAGQQKKAIRLPWIIGSISAVAASVAIIVSVFIGGKKDELPADYMADAVEDTSYVDNPVDSISSVDAVESFDIPEAKEYIAEQKTVEQSPVEMPVKSMKQPDNLDDFATAGQTQANFFQMLKPAKSPYRVKVRNVENEFVFEWTSEGLEWMLLTITDASGKEVYKKEISDLSVSKCGIKASELVDKGELDWTVYVRFNDAKEETYSGKVEFVSAK